MPLYNNVIRQVKEEEENPGAALERAKDIGKSAIKFLGPDPDSPTFVQEVGAEFLEMAAHKNPYTYIGAQIAQNIPAIKTGKEVLEKSYKSVLDTAFSPFKRAAQTWDDFTYMIGGGVGTGTGVGPGDIRPKPKTKRYVDGREIPEFDVEAAENVNVSRIEMTSSDKAVKPKKSSVVTTKGKIKPLDAGIDANIDKFSAILEYSDLSPTDAGKWKNKVTDFLNQANKHRNAQIAAGNTTKPLDGFEFIETVGRKKVNTRSRSLIGPDGRVWTVRGPSGSGKNAKGWRIKSRDQLTSYQDTRAFRDLTSSPEQALARKRLDQFRSNENKILKAKREALQNKAPWDMTKQEADWLEWSTHQEYYGEHIRRLSDANPYWRTPEYLKGTMKRGDVANYQVFSNQIEKSFKDSIESIIYGTKSKKHYGGYLSTTGNQVTLGMTNDLTSLTLEEILPSGALRRINEIPLSRAYEEGIDFKKLVSEYLGPPPTILKFKYKNPGPIKTLSRMGNWKDYLDRLFEERPKGFYPTKTETILKKTKYLSRE